MGIATGFVTKNNFTRSKTAGLYVACFKFRINNLSYFSCTEIHFTNSAKSWLYLYRLVTFRQESVFHHTFLFLFRTLTLNSYVGIIIITIHSISSRTSHLSGESSYESFISGWFTYFSLFYIGKEFIQVHYIHVPVFFFFPADKHTIRFISQKSTAQVRSFRSLNNLTGGHFNKVNLCRSPFTFFSVRKRTFHLFVISTAGRPEQ